MLYLLDANVLITAERTYYPLDQVPEFWEWLRAKAEDKNIQIPTEILSEILKGGQDAEKDPLLHWLISGDTKSVLQLEEDVEVDLVRHVVETGYAPDLTDTEIEQIGLDPFLIAYALRDRENRKVVTIEVSRPSRKRQNRHVPDVCSDLAVNSCTVFTMLRELGFSTSWNR